MSGSPSLPSTQAFGRLRKLLCSPALGWLWLAAMVLSAMLAVQQVAGWPGYVTVRIPAAPAGEMQAITLPARYRVSDWNAPMIRVPGLPRYLSRELLEEGSAAGYAVKGGRVVLRRTAEFTPSGIRLPWEVRSAVFWKLTALLLLWTALLGWSANPVTAVIWHWAVRAHFPWFTAVLALAVFIAAIAIRARGFSFPAWANDTDGYFRQVFAVVRGANPSTTPDRPFGYPLAMGLLLRAVRDLRAVVLAQEIATLCAASAVAAIVWLAGRRLFSSAPARSMAALLGTFGFAALALNESLLQREWALLTEAWAALYLGVQALLTWYLTARLRTLRASVLPYAGLCAAGLLTFFTKANWGFALAVLPIPWLAATLLSAGSRREFWQRSFAGALVLLALAAAGFGYQAHCSRLSGLASLQERARALVCWHVPLVRPEIDRRLRGRPAEPERAVLQEMAGVMDGELADSKASGAGAYPSLGYDPDDLYFERLPHAPHFAALSPAQQTVLCTGLFKEALRADPMAYLRKVAGQMPIFFTHPYQKVSFSRHLVAGALAQSEAAAAHDPVLPPEFARPYAETLARAKQEFAGPWPSVAREVLCERMRAVFSFLAASFGWTLSLPMLLCAAAGAWPAWRRRVAWSSLAPALTVAIWSAGSVTLSALSSAVTQGLDIPRYIQLSAPLTLLAQLLWPLLGVSVLRPVALCFAGDGYRGKRVAESATDIQETAARRLGYDGVR